MALTSGITTVQLGLSLLVKLPLYDEARTNAKVEDQTGAFLHSAA
jgi:hypothetical protein